ncbi:EAL domain-containing protein [Salinisphaera sp. SPP-AMP-43]|uniref:EAL domain-containing protein n=1 Tax=Salinisphaera sp. SPP-AMP-43 TaxID=3121288 RepID=UPI003C6E5E2D
MTADSIMAAPERRTCRICGPDLDFDFTMAFQPLVDLAAGQVYGHEALVRGTNGEGAGEVLSRLTPATVYRFDQACRVKALKLAHALGGRSTLSINFLPNAVYAPASCIQATLEVSYQLGWPADRINFEITETEQVRNRAHLQNIINTYREMGFKTALDDFGTGYANLDLLVDLQPDVVKIDRALIRDIPEQPRRQTVVNAVIGVANRLGIGLVAEGVETLEEAIWLYSRGITRHQGYLYARPAIEALPGVDSALMHAVVEGARNSEGCR